MQLDRHWIIFTFFLPIWASTADADIVDITGAVVEIDPPASVDIGALQSDTDIRLFTENEDQVLGRPVDVDVTVPGTYNSLAGLTPSVLGAGETVNTYYLHLNGTGPLVTLTGSVTFDSEVIGVIIVSDNLNASEPGLGHAATTYPQGNSFRGFEFGGGNVDVLTLSADRKTVTVTLNATTQPDQVRIITEPDPPPSPVKPATWGAIKSTFNR